MKIIRQSRVITSYSIHYTKLYEYTWVKFGKSDVGMTLNGALAGLVGITAGCANVSPVSAVIIGIVAGILVVVSVLTLDKLKIDDPVGAVSAHGVCGAWGTLAAGIFDQAGFSLSVVGIQLLGIAACFVWAFGSGMILFKTIDAVIGMRVTRDEELAGLDFAEHGANSYPDFHTVSTLADYPSDSTPKGKTAKEGSTIAVEGEGIRV